MTKENWPNPANHKGGWNELCDTIDYYAFLDVGDHNFISFVVLLVLNTGESWQYSAKSRDENVDYKADNMVRGAKT